MLGSHGVATPATLVYTPLTVSHAEEPSVKPAVAVTVQVAPWVVTPVQSTVAKDASEGAVLGSHGVATPATLVYVPSLGFASMGSGGDSGVRQGSVQATKESCLPDKRSASGRAGGRGSIIDRSRCARSTHLAHFTEPRLNPAAAVTAHSASVVVTPAQSIEVKDAPSSGLMELSPGQPWLVLRGWRICSSVRWRQTRARAT